MLMINTILRNFLKRPATRKYPMVKRDPFSNYRGRLINNVEPASSAACARPSARRSAFPRTRRSFLGI